MGPKLAKHLVHLFSDNQTAVAIFQAGRGSDPFLQVCVKEIWLTSAIRDTTLAIGHVAGDSLNDTVDALTHWSLGQIYRDRVDALMKHRGISCMSVPQELLHISKHL